MVVLWLCLGAIACSKKGGSSAATSPTEENNGGYSWTGECCMKDNQVVDDINCFQNKVECVGEHWGIVEDWYGSSVYWVDCNANYGASGHNNCSGYMLVENTTNNYQTDLNNNTWKYCK